MLTETQTTTRVVSLDLRLSLRVATAEGRVRNILHCPTGLPQRDLTPSYITCEKVGHWRGSKRRRAATR